MCFTTFKLKNNIQMFYINFALFISKIQYTVVILCILPFSLLAMYSYSDAGRLFYLNHFVNGFNLKTWVDKNIPHNSSILLDHRSKSLYQRDVVSFEIFEYSKQLQDRNVALDVLGEQLIKYNVKYLVTTSNSGNLSEVKSCSESLAAGPEKMLSSTRNPWNSSYFDGYIFNITPNNFISCLKQTK